MQSKYAIHGQVQKNVTSAKYLGLNIYKTLSWDNHVNKVTQKAHNSNPYPSQAETSAVAQQTSTPNAIPHLQDHPWNTRLQFGAQQRKNASVRSRQSKRDTAGSQT